MPKGQDSHSGRPASAPPPSEPPDVVALWTLAHEGMDPRAPLEAYAALSELSALALLCVHSGAYLDEGGTPGRAVEGTPQTPRGVPDDPTAATEAAARSMGLAPRPHAQ